MKVGLIGAGGIAQAHLPALCGNTEISSVVVADVDPDRLRHTKSSFPSVDTVSDYRVLLEDPGVAVVDICLPHYLHRAVATEAFNAGKHVLCEKPIATTVSDAEAMKQAAAENGLCLGILLNQMFSPAHRTAKEMLHDGLLGKVFLGVWNMIGDELARMDQPDNWKGDREKAGGGALMDTGMHAAYVMLDFFGPAKRVCALTKRAVVQPSNKGEDNAAVSIEFEGGTIVSYAQSYSVTSERWNERKHVYGTKGSLHIDDTSVTAPLTLCTPTDKTPRVVDVPQRDDLQGWTVAEGVRHHINHISQGTPLLYGTDLAIDALCLILACYRSVDEGRVVTLSEVQ